MMSINSSGNGGPRKVLGPHRKRTWELGAEFLVLVGAARGEKHEIQGARELGIPHPPGLRGFVDEIEFGLFY